MDFLKRFAPLVGVLAALAILAGCGSDSDAGSATAQGTVASSESSGRYEPGPLSVPGKGPSKYVIPGHREDLPRFGEEASRGELEQAAKYVHGYGVARLEKDWPEACSYASASMVRRLAAQQGQPGAGCEAVLAKVPDIVLGSDYERTEVSADSLRTDGRQGFLLYRGATAPYFMPVRREGALWRVDSKAPTPFYYAKQR
jgi:hypothetical protein